MVEIFGKTKKKHKLKMRRGNVTGISIFDNRFARITVVGEDFDDMSLEGPCDHFKLALPRSDGSCLSFDEQSLKFLGGEITRDITAKRPIPGGVEIEVALHAGGELYSWISNLQKYEGSRYPQKLSEILLLGPKSSIILPKINHLVIAVDHAAYPALTRWLDILGDEADVDIFLISDWNQNQEYFGKHWQRQNLKFNVISPDYSGETLLQAIHWVHLYPDHYIWFAAEATTLIKARKWLRTNSVVPKENMKIDGYWKEGIAGRSHHDPIDPNEPELG